MRDELVESTEVSGECLAQMESGLVDRGQVMGGEREDSPWYNRLDLLAEPLAAVGHLFCG